MDLNPLEQLNLITIAAIAAIFLMTFLVLRRVFFLPLIEVMEKRDGKLERSLARYQESGALIEQAEAEAKRIATEAAAAAERLFDDARGEVARFREAKRAEASAEAEIIITQGRDEVARLRETEQARLNEHLVACSRQTLLKMLHEVNEETLQSIVNRVLTAKGTARKP
jgi:F0F1-type ATP synthase membrane subunit b/b'